MLDTTRKQISRIRKTTTLILFLCLEISGCLRTDGQVTMSPSSNFPIAIVSIAPKELPDYLTAVWPMQSSMITVSEYMKKVNSTIQGGVGVRLQVDRVYPYFLGEDFGDIEYSEATTIDLREHMELLMDGERISQELLHANALDSVSVRDQTGMLLYSGVGQMDIFWSIHLSQGDYTASLNIYNRVKTIILKYEWNSKISD